MGRSRAGGPGGSEVAGGADAGVAGGGREAGGARPRPRPLLGTQRVQLVVLLDQGHSEGHLWLRCTATARQLWAK